MQHASLLKVTCPRQHALGSVTLQKVHVQATSSVQERLYGQAILPHLLPRPTQLSPSAVSTAH